MFNRFYILLFISIALISCNQKAKHNQLNTQQNKSESKPVSDTVQDSVFLSMGLYSISNLNPNIRVDLKYTTNDNFLQKVLYKKIDKAYLQKDVAIRLSKCQDFLDSIMPGYHLIVYDAVRPVSVQKIMWKAMDSLPPKIRKRYVSPPQSRSLHNFGAAVDISLMNGDQLLDMGSDFDEFNEIAYPRMEDEFLKKGKLSHEQYENRKLLRKVMDSQNFEVLSTEWWHFNACSFKHARTNYKVLLEE